ncbi:MAG: NAD-dependent malic enzyme [Chitinophagales bacterium]|jgi:malate dehydrogenase (oxaloacetate-decarboxylating)|nr:NAD-dependent malic enzyme [Chitinophagales bacterium]
MKSIEDIYQQSLQLHAKHKGKISIVSKIALRDAEDLSLAYSPGVAAPCLAIQKDPHLARKYTIKNNTVGIISDGSAVLGLGNIGADAAIPVMEGKAILFKEFAGLDAFPICIKTQDTHKIIELVRNIAPVFGGINLEDISAPKCFEIEQSLQDLGIPVFHDDQHGTAIVLIAALLNSCKVLDKKFEDLKVVVNGSGAAGISIIKMLKKIDINHDSYLPVREVIACDSIGIISKGRKALNPEKTQLLAYTNTENIAGTLSDALHGADVFIGVSKADVLRMNDIKSMNAKPIIFALANPTPEIMPDLALKAGAAIVCTGRSDFPNQVNNVLAFPGIFKGALTAGATQITNEMKLAASYAIASCVSVPKVDCVIPSPFDKNVVEKVSQAIIDICQNKTN